MTKITKGIAALFLSAVGAGALVAERDTILEQSVDHNFYAGAWFATRVLAADINDDQNLPILGIHASQGEQSKARIMLDLGANAESRREAFRDIANARNPVWGIDYPVPEAVRESTLEMVASYETDPALKQEMKDYALEYAAMEKSTDIMVGVVRYLLEQGANPNAPSKALEDYPVSTRTLASASWARGDREPMITVLMNHGADPALGIRFFDQIDPKHEAETYNKGRDLILKVARKLGKPVPGL